MGFVPITNVDITSPDSRSGAYLVHLHPPALLCMLCAALILLLEEFLLYICAYAGQAGRGCETSAVKLRHILRNLSASAAICTVALTIPAG